MKWLRIRFLIFMQLSAERENLVRLHGCNIPCTRPPSKAFIEYRNDINDIYKNIEEYNVNKKRKIMIDFNDMIVVY